MRSPSVQPILGLGFYILVCLAWNENRSIMSNIGFHTSGEVMTESLDSTELLARASLLLRGELSGLGTATAVGWATTSVHMMSSLISWLCWYFSPLSLLMDSSASDSLPCLTSHSGDSGR